MSILPQTAHASLMTNDVIFQPLYLVGVYQLHYTVAVDVTVLRRFTPNK